MLCVESSFFDGCWGCSKSGATIMCSLATKVVQVDTKASKIR
jgi:hypothetical protein